MSDELILILVIGGILVGTAALVVPLVVWATIHQRGEDRKRAAEWAQLATHWNGTMTGVGHPMQIDGVLDGVPVRAATLTIKGERLLARAKLLRTDLPPFSVREGSGLTARWLRLNLPGVPDRSVILASEHPEHVLQALSRDADALAAWAGNRGSLYIECDGRSVEMRHHTHEDLQAVQRLVYTCARIARA